jgi:hypothetical protein
MKRLSLVLMVAAGAGCGDAAKHTFDDAGKVGDARPDGRAVDGAVDAPACVAGVACATNPGAPCLTGAVSCASGVASCVDAAPAADGTTCGAGLCTLGGCLPATAIATSADLGQVALTSGRDCAEAPSYPVAALTATAATLAVAPVGDCLVAGDEVMLINLQGRAGAVANVGNWELLRVASVAGAAVAFTATHARAYGAAAGSDAGIGAGPTDQRVEIVRVPRLGATTIAVATTLTTTAWDGARGGVLALRVGSLAVDGTISMATAGYRPGAWSISDGACDANVATEAGESYTGPAVASTSRNGGGAGGIAAATGISFNNNTPVTSSAGHATAGQAGFNASGRTLGQPGAVYGAADASLLTMGSGGAGDLGCTIGGPPGGALSASVLPRGGGIVVVIGGDLTVNAGGAIVATPADAGRDTASSGGYVYLRGGNVTVGTNRVTAKGSVAHGGSAPTAGQSNVGGDGYVVIQASGTVVGTTSPAATRL